MVRAIGALDAVPLPGTTNASSPFLSPDGRWVGFFTGVELRKVCDRRGAAGRRCALIVGATRGGSWGPDDTIVFATADSTTGLLQHAPPGAGEPTVLTTPDTAHGEGDHHFPSILPGGRAVLFTITSSSGGIETAQVAVRDLHDRPHDDADSRREPGRVRRPLDDLDGLGASGSGQAGYLVYVVAGTLHAVRFNPIDARGGEPSGGRQSRR